MITGYITSLLWVNNTVQYLEPQRAKSKEKAQVDGRENM